MRHWARAAAAERTRIRSAQNLLTVMTQETDGGTGVDPIGNRRFPIAFSDTAGGIEITTCEIEPAEIAIVILTARGAGGGRP